MASATMAIAAPAIFNPMKVSPRAAPQITKPTRLAVRGSLSTSNREKAVSVATAAAMAAALVLPEIAEAAQPGLSPSLKNFLLSIVSGGVVFTGIIGVVVGVSNFDPVTRA